MLLVEDDDGDALIVEELLSDAAEPFDLIRARTVHEAVHGPHAGIDCLLLDLGLPDAHGIDALTTVLDAAPGIAVVVLTGLLDAERGIQAVSAGAQDYLVKGHVDGVGLSRAVRYAAERRAIDETRRRMLIAERRQRENARMAHGLLPQPLVGDPCVAVTTRYQPGGPDAQLGGDFYDVIETRDGTIRAVIGDVCGHGPDEAALGVAMRIAWRSLVRAGLKGDDIVTALDDVFTLERRDRFLFTTICDIEVPVDRTTLTMRLCGHPPPLLVHPEVRWLDLASTNPPLGIHAADEAITSHTVDLPAHWAIVLLTDGLFEGRSGDGRLGMDGLHDVTSRLCAEGKGPDELLDDLIAAARDAHGTELPDDVALVCIESHSA